MLQCIMLYFTLLSLFTLVIGGQPSTRRSCAPWQ